jgi:septal ring factor EnvC (AmiA/AmiB activator)
MTAASAQVPTFGTTLDDALAQAQAEASFADAEVRRLEQAGTRARNRAQSLRIRQLAAAQAIAAAEARISAADAEIRLAAARQQVLRNRLTREQQPVSALLAGLVIMADRPPLLSLAGANSSEELVRIRLLVDSTLPAIRERTRNLTDQLSANARLKNNTDAARQRLQASRNELAARQRQFAILERQALTDARATDAQALTAGDAAITAEEAADMLGSDARQARAAAAVAAHLAREAPPPAGLVNAGSGAEAPFHYALPAKAPVQVGLGTISASGVRSRGIVLGTRRGTAITAPARGSVRFAGPFREYDGVVILDHGRGWLSLIVNVASQLQRGEKVAVGEPIGRALGAVEVELSHNGRRLSPALIAGSSPPLSKGR